MKKVKLSPKLIKVLIGCSLKVHSRGSKPTLKNFFLTEANNMMPVNVKIKGSVSANSVYRAYLKMSPSHKFTDASGRHCESRDMLTVRLYEGCAPTIADICKSPGSKYDIGELRFIEFTNDKELEITPSPILQKRVKGVRGRGCLYIATPNVDYSTKIINR